MLSGHAVYDGDGFMTGTPRNERGCSMIYYVEDDDNIRGLTLYALHQQGIEAEGFSCVASSLSFAPP